MRKSLEDKSKKATILDKDSYKIAGKLIIYRTQKIKSFKKNFDKNKTRT